MKRLLHKFAEMFAPYRRISLHVLCFFSFVAVILGWSFFDMLGPMGLILPSVTAIGTGLSEIDRFLEPGYLGKPILRRFKPASGKAPILGDR